MIPRLISAMVTKAARTMEAPESDVARLVRAALVCLGIVAFAAACKAVRP